MGKSKGTKVFTEVREFEIADEYEDFRERFRHAKDHGIKTIDATLLDDPITFAVDKIGAFIPMIDLGF
jgi:hypothetical protein